MPNGKKWRDLFDMVSPDHSVHRRCSCTAAQSFSALRKRAIRAAMSAGLVQVIVQARKPDFFNNNMSLYEVVTEDGLMRPAMTARKVALPLPNCQSLLSAGMTGDESRMPIGDFRGGCIAVARRPWWRKPSGSRATTSCMLGAQTPPCNTNMRRQIVPCMHNAPA